MRLIITLSLRNLIRQRRKNLLLGSAIAFGVMILVVTTSFVSGITDTLFNRVVVYLTGHIELHMAENGSQYYSVHRDKKLMTSLIKTHVHGIKAINENVSSFCRGIGNGKSDNLILIGIPPKSSEILSQFKVIEGNYANFENNTIDNPVILSESKAKYLNIKVDDLLRIRLRTINGQQQSAIMRVVAIVQSSNMFLDVATYTRLSDIKKIMGYQPYETGSLQIILNDPLSAPEQADTLHAALTSPPMWIHGTTPFGTAWISGFKKNESDIVTLKKMIRIVAGDTSFSKQTVLISRPFADAHQLDVGSLIPVSYDGRLTPVSGSMSLIVTAIYEPIAENIPNSVIMVHESTLISEFYRLLPDNSQHPPELNQLHSLLIPEWTLLPRTKTSDEFKKKNQELGRLKLKNGVLDVRTMVETASTILTFDAALKIITYSGAALLFAIILIGMINSLRMNIRERTREIGTMRAIGIPQKMILQMLILESFFLAFFASILGLCFAIGVMKLLGSIPFYSQTPLNIFLVNHRLHFLLQWPTTLLNVAIITLICVITTYFPSKAAARMKCVDALRHSEG